MLRVFALISFAPAWVASCIEAGKDAIVPLRKWLGDPKESYTNPTVQKGLCCSNAPGGRPPSTQLWNTAPVGSMALQTHGRFMVSGPIPPEAISPHICFTVMCDDSRDISTEAGIRLCAPPAADHTKFLDRPWKLPERRNSCKWYNHMAEGLDSFSIYVPQYWLEWEAVLQRYTGHNATVQCDSSGHLSGIWYYYFIRRSVVDEELNLLELPHALPSRTPSSIFRKATKGLMLA
ncbi:uncharacterized protein EI90DRAFT_3014787 [Cantharellus anzutake]|uniref:uncharacterized protein n=1 Tax=Cantharellus anzutake TaxID=1750568 RepID=UPI001906762E|nr:uncharacterized protein EI90DRAFT_3014787 [Cantharellus anzutake]KAF8334961.1 hypothetical protein EI90DRAFT_3014787 [Cantharellus anzutake]